MRLAHKCLSSELFYNNISYQAWVNEPHIPMISSTGSLITMLNSKRKPNIQTINMVIIANSNEIQEEVKVMFIGSFKSMLRIKYARILWQSIPIVTG